MLNNKDCGLNFDQDNIVSFELINKTKALKHKI